jgi:alpha-ketoglutarate-dependent taurine dioxygenase
MEKRVTSQTEVTRLDAELTQSIDDTEIVATINASLGRTGAILVQQHLPTRTTARFGELTRRLSGGLMQYSDGTTPRTSLGDNVYTSTNYPPHARIEFHSELSYSAVWPSKLYFCCEKPANQGGRTLIADNRLVLSRLNVDVLQEFRARGWRYVRNVRSEFGVPWQEALGTDSRKEAERRLKESSVTYEWRADGSIRLEAQRPATRKHPSTGEEAWFNHILLFHPSSLPPGVADALTELYGVDGLPSNAYYGDGGAIPEDVIEHIRECYTSVQYACDWKLGDVLVIDNVLMAHARESFTGTRSVLVAMSSPQMLSAPAPRAAT